MHVFPTAKLRDTIANYFIIVKLFPIFRGKKCNNEGESDHKFLSTIYNYVKPYTWRLAYIFRAWLILLIRIQSLLIFGHTFSTFDLATFFQFCFIQFKRAFIIEKNFLCLTFLISILLSF